MKGNKLTNSRPNIKHQEALESYCDVCFGYFRKVPAKKINEHLQILLCTKCNCKVHKCCYDLQSNQTYITQKLRQFICNRCSSKDTLNKQCCVCHGKDGAMKTIQGNQVVHVFCALYHSQFQIIEYYPQIKVKKSLFYSQSQDKCQICLKTNAFQKCAMQGCQRVAHAYCAKKKFIQQQMQVQQPKCWNHHLTSGSNGLLDLSEQIIPFPLFKEEVQRQLTDLKEQNVSVLNQNQQEIKKLIYQTYFNDLKKKKKNSKKLKRGGFSFISCPVHEMTPNCLCRGTVLEGAMVQCQCCFSWFHYSCIKTEPLSQEQSFICHPCKSFYELKRKIIQELSSGKLDSFQIKCEVPLKTNYMDYMWFLRAIDNRIAKGSAAKMFKQLQKYPLKSSKMNFLIKIQCRDKLDFLCEIFYRKYFCEEDQLKRYKPLSVLKMNFQQKVQTIEQNVIKNKQLQMCITKIREFLKQQGIQDPFAKLQKEFEFKEEAISDQYEKIIELSKSQQRYQEVEILKIKAQVYSFLQIVKKVNTGTTIITFNELQQSLQKAQKIEHIPQYLIKPLKDKYQQVKSLVQCISITIRNTPNQHQLITQQVQELQKLNISPPYIYCLYKQEKNLINKLHIFCLKQTGNKIQEQIQTIDKIKQLLNVTMIIGNQELVNIINDFNISMQKFSFKQQYIFEGVRQIVYFFQKQSVIYEIKDKINKKVCKWQKLKRLFKKINLYQISEDNYKQLSNQFNKILSLMQQSVMISLSQIDNIVDITSLHQKCKIVISLLEMYPIQIQTDQTPKFTNWLKLSQNRKKQLEQLLTLCTQSQLKKNPLSFQKVMPLISRQNRLVKEFYNLKKQQVALKQRFTYYLGKSSQKTQFFRRQSSKKLSRKQQLKQNSQKPSLDQINEFIQQLKNKKIDFKQEIEQLKRLLNMCIQISSKVNKYCHNKNQFQSSTSVSQLNENRKEIQQLRRKVLCFASFNLQAELTLLYHTQIHNRMKSTVLTLSSSLDIDKIGKLLKFAEQEGIINSLSYKKLKQKFDSKNQKTKEFTQIKNIQNQLQIQATKDNDYLYKNLYSLRKSLNLSDLNSEVSKISYIEEMKQKNKQIRSKISSLFTKQTSLKPNFNQAKSIFLQALKSPFSVPQLSKLQLQLQKCHQILRKWKDLHRNPNSKISIFGQYSHLIFKIDQIQTAKKQQKSNELFLQKMTLHCLKYDQQSKFQIQQIMNKLEESIVQKQNDIIYQAKKLFISFWHNYIIKIRQQKTQYISFQKLKKILYDSYYCLQNDLRKGSTGQQYRFAIEHIQRVFSKLKKQVQTGNYQKNNTVDGYIDIDQLLYSLKAGTDIDDLLNILKPYDELSKFKLKNLNKIETKIKQQAFKRQRSDDFEFLKRPSQKQFQAKIQEFSESENEESQNQTNIVTDKSRKKIKQILLKNIRKNLQLKKYGDCQNQVKMIENQIFGQFHNDVLKYFEMSQKFEKLFIKLHQCPNISQKLIKKQFDFKFIKLLVQNLSNISQFQRIMVNKIKEQDKLKTIHKINQEIDQSEQKSQTKKGVLQMLASGKVDQIYRKQIKKQIKMIKQNKHKKRRHKHKRSRSNSRSKSPDAKFSSQSQQQNQLPSYIKNQYSEGLTEKIPKPYDFSQIMEKQDKQAPLMFDPDEEQNVKQNLQNQFPKGSVLKIKSLQLQMYLKKKGKVQIKANLLSDQQYRKITVQLVDPGCSKLNIRKQKNDKQIIEYLNKPNRKKYKYLVGWIQATNEQDNIMLRDLSLQANERQKIFGWQNQLIKIHIMSIKQFVQINKFSSTPSLVSSEVNAKLFDTQRIVFIIQYPVDKMFELKQKLSGFKDIQKINDPHKVSIPLPTYEAMDIENPYGYFQPSLINKQSSGTIKPLNYQDPVAKNVQFQGWGNINTDVQSNRGTIAQKQIDLNNPYQMIRHTLGFVYFSPIQSDEQNNLNEQKDDLVQSLLKSVNQPTPSLNLPSNLPPYSNIRNQQSYHMHNQPYNRYPPYQNNMQRYPNQVNPTIAGNQGGYQNWNNQPPRYQPYNKTNLYVNNQGYGQMNNSYQSQNMGRNPMIQNQNARRNPMFNQNAGNNQIYPNQNMGNPNPNNQGNTRNNMGQGQYQSNRYNSYK